MAIEIRYHLKHDEAELLLRSMKGIRPFEEVDLITFSEMITRLEVLIENHRKNNEREERKNEVLLELLRQTKTKEQKQIKAPNEERKIGADLQAYLDEQGR